MARSWLAIWSLLAFVACESADDAPGDAVAGRAGGGRSGSAGANAGASHAGRGGDASAAGAGGQSGRGGNAGSSASVGGSLNAGSAGDATAARAGAEPLAGRGGMGSSGDGGSFSGGTTGVAGGGSANMAGGGGSAGARGDILEVVDVTDVWAGHPVGFSLLTHGDRQFAAFYDRDRALTVADRALGSPTWKLVRLPTAVGWDSHNDIVMAIDDDGYIHVSGNMHSSALIYFRSANPLDIDDFEQLSMLNMNETSCTYPQFFRSPAGDLIFMYRDGESGNGNHIFNRYSTAEKRWTRLLGSALTDGEGQRNAYPVGPIQGPDGLFHLVWVWRDTPDASTNHDLSYAKTADLLNWQRASGAAVTLPITLAGGDIVDAVPINGGMINNNTKVGFDAQQRPIVAYHKYDANGDTQLYNARFENGAWVPHRTSDWDYRWEFGGGGTLVFEIEVEPVELQPDGTLTQNFYHAREGGLGAFRLDPVTLAAEASIPQPVPYPPELAEVESTTAEMQVRWRKDSGAGPDDNVIYMLRWETLPSNRDQPRPNAPPPSKLRLYGFRR
jgi:hypothetical protein